MNPKIKVCLNPKCNKEYFQTRSDHVYCSKPCGKQLSNKAWRAAHKEYIKAYRRLFLEDYMKEYLLKYGKEYRKTEKGKEAMRLGAQRCREKYPERYNARLNARQNIKRKPCVVGGCNELGERHHPDYNKPLDIISLCPPPHSALHKELRKQQCLNAL